MAEDLQVFGFWASPFSRRVELVLKLKSVHYEYIEEDLKNKSDLLLKYNPIYKKVPVLVHHGKPIAESQVILEYIEENWKANPILPEDPHERALARFWAKFVDDKVGPAILKTVRSKGEEREEAIKEAQETLLEPLEKELGSKRFFGGERFGFVDIVAIIVGYWIPAIEEAVGFELLGSEKFPRLSKWSEELVSHCVVKEFLPPKQELIAHLQAVLPTN